MIEFCSISCILLFDKQKYGRFSILFNSNSMYSIRSVFYITSFVPSCSFTFRIEQYRFLHKPDCSECVEHTTFANCSGPAVRRKENKNGILAKNMRLYGNTQKEIRHTPLTHRAHNQCDVLFKNGLGMRIGIGIGIEI